VTYARARTPHWRWRLAEEVQALKQQWLAVLVCVFVLVYGTLIVFLNVAYYRYGKAYHNEDPHKCFQDLEQNETATLCVPRRLHDLGYDIVPELSQNAKDHYTNIPLYFLFLSLALTAIGLLCPPRELEPTLPPPKNPRRSPDGFRKPLFINVARRFGCVYAIGHTLRACTYIATSVPGAADHCLISADIKPPSVAQIFYKPASTEENCGDLIFSGHMLICILCVLVVHRYGAAALQLQRNLHITFIWLNVFAAFAQTIMILGARHHYSVDVVVSWYVTPLLWHFYNTEMPPDVEPDMRAFSERLLARESDARRQESENDPSLRTC